MLAVKLSNNRLTHGIGFEPMPRRLPTPRLLDHCGPVCCFSDWFLQDDCGCLTMDNTLGWCLWHIVFACADSRRIARSLVGFVLSHPEDVGANIVEDILI